MVELLVAATILGVLIGFIFFLINPIKQINKINDAQKKHNIVQIRTALDGYFNDHNCYPKSTEFSLGEEFKDPQNANVIYMKDVPQELNCLGGGVYCYAYQTNEDEDCPQWNVVYTKLYDDSSDSNVACPLTKISGNCLPQNYSTLGYNGCLISGNVDCSYISTHSLPLQPTPTPSVVVSTSTPTPTITITPSQSPSPSVTPTDTPTPTPVCSQDYACTGGPPARCNLVYPGTGTYCSSNCNGDCL